MYYLVRRPMHMDVLLALVPFWSEPEYAESRKRWLCHKEEAEARRSSLYDLVHVDDLELHVAAMRARLALGEGTT